MYVIWCLDIKEVKFEEKKPPSTQPPWGSTLTTTITGTSDKKPTIFCFFYVLSQMLKIPLEVKTFYTQNRKFMRHFFLEI